MSFLRGIWDRFRQWWLETEETQVTIGARAYVCPCCNRTIYHPPPCWKYRGLGPVDGRAWQGGAR